MKQVEVYNKDYVELNHSYNVIYHAYEKLIQCDDAENEILSCFEVILRTMNPMLDEIKSRMTVKTRYKDDAPSQQKNDNPNVIQFIPK